MRTIDFSRFHLVPGDVFLDVGCGEGRHTVQACQVPDTICIAGDLDPDNLKQTKKKIHFHEQVEGIACQNFSFTALDITCLPFEDATFDKIICSEVLEHIPDDVTAISELDRILKPGGMLAISVPGFFPEKLCWVLAKDYANTEGGHIRIYTKKNLLAKLTAQGLIPVASHRAHSLHTPYWWIRCLAGLDNENSFPVRLLHRFLIWDMMEKPKCTEYMDKLFNPLLGKSLVIYLVKPTRPGSQP